MSIIYKKYLNLQKFIKDYRQWQVDSNFLDEKTFNKEMTLNHVVRCDCTDPKNNKKIIILLLKNDSKHTKTTPNFTRMINALGKTVMDVYVITKVPLSIYIKKVIPSFSNMNIKNYLHRHFIIEIPKGPLCSPHVILTPEEVTKLCSKDLMAHPLSLPSISVNDPQCIWIGAEIGQVVKIESLSALTGRSVRYRIVSPVSGMLEMDDYNDKKNDTENVIGGEDVEIIADDEPDEPDEMDEPDID